MNLSQAIMKQNAQAVEWRRGKINREPVSALLRQLEDLRRSSDPRNESGLGQLIASIRENVDEAAEYLA